MTTLKHHDANADSGSFATHHSGGMTLLQLRDTIGDLVPSSNFIFKSDKAPFLEPLCTRVHIKKNKVAIWLYETEDHKVIKYFRDMGGNFLDSYEFIMLDTKGEEFMSFKFDGEIPRSRDVKQLFDSSLVGPNYKAVIKSIRVTYVRNTYGSIV